MEVIGRGGLDLRWKKGVLVIIHNVSLDCPAAAWKDMDPPRVEFELRLAS